MDAALGAEGMVETLTEKNLELEEKIQELETQVTDLVSTAGSDTTFSCGLARLRKQCLFCEFWLSRMYVSELYPISQHTLFD